MKTKYIIFLIVVLLAFNSTGCSVYYSDMSGTVVDAETGKPIEGAVVFVEWTKKHGIGDYHTESVKVSEVVTDKEGKFKLPGITKLFVEPPDLAAYKKGYVCWSSRIIFPDWRNRTDFKWGDSHVFKLEHFKPEYTYSKHTSFISSAVNSPIGKKDLIKNAYRWEELEASKERDR